MAEWSAQGLPSAVSGELSVSEEEQLDADWLDPGALFLPQLDLTTSPLHPSSVLDTFLAPQQQHELIPATSEPAANAIQQQLIGGASSGLRGTEAVAANILFQKINPVHSASHCVIKQEHLPEPLQFKQENANSTEPEPAKVSAEASCSMLQAIPGSRAVGSAALASAALAAAHFEPAALSADVAASTSSTSFVVNLTKARITSKLLAELKAKYSRNDLIMATEAAQRECAADAYYARGPQAMRRTLMRRLCALFPKAEAMYVAINTVDGLSSTGGQWNRKQCEKFFKQVLGPQSDDPASAPWPAEQDLKPVKELEYLARLLNWMLDRSMYHCVTAEQVNACFIAGHHEYKVDYSKLVQLGVKPSEITLPLKKLVHGECWVSGLSSNTTWGASMTASPPAAVGTTGQAAAMMRAGMRCQATKNKSRKRSQQSAGSNKKARAVEAAAAEAAAAQRLLFAAGNAAYAAAPATISM